MIYSYDVLRNTECKKKTRYRKACDSCAAAKNTDKQKIATTNAKQPQ